MIDLRSSNCWFCDSPVIRFALNPTIHKCSGCERLARGWSGGWMKLYFENSDVVMYIASTSKWILYGAQNPDAIYEDRPILLEGSDVENDWDLTDMKALEKQVQMFVLFM